MKQPYRPWERSCIIESDRPPLLFYHSKNWSYIIDQEKGRREGRELAGSARDVVRTHIDHLVEQLTHLIRDGVAQGEFATDEPDRSARAVYTATPPFHDTAHGAVWS